MNRCPTLVSANRSATVLFNDTGKPSLLHHREKCFACWMTHSFMKFVGQLIAVPMSLLLTTGPAGGATAAFCGKVTAVKKAETKQKDTLVHFTVEIDYFDYLSRGGGRHSKVGHTSGQRVLKLGSVCVIDGRMVNAATFAKAIRPGLWGYFYETTWLDLQTTPNFQWGEVMAFGKDAFTLRIHRTHKDVHIETNPPVEVKVPYDANVSFRLEDKPTDAAKALAAGDYGLEGMAGTHLSTVERSLRSLRSAAGDF